jgi:hypothetical protein
MHTQTPIEFNLYNFNLIFIIKVSMKGLVLFAIMAALTIPNAKAQDNRNSMNHFRGNISITNNGLSLIPAFSLNRPAAIFELSLGGERLSFDPEMRFALDGKPWSFIFWWRYKIIKSEKFRLHIGAHPAFIFENKMVDDGSGTMVSSMEAKRFFAGEISPRYSINDKTTISFLYLAGRSLGKVPYALNQFVALGTQFTKIPLSQKYFFNASPQVFYLKMNEKDGYFASSSFVIGKKDLPVSLGSTISRKIVSEIDVNDWIWNISLVYSFNNEFVKRSNPLL